MNPSPVSAGVRVRQAIRDIWGYRQLRPLQSESIAALLAGRDSLTVLPTGSGKSLCYQAPAVGLGGLGVVISPLIALMTDQVDALAAHGVEAACLHSALDPVLRGEIFRGLSAGRYRLLYLSPERLNDEWMIQQLAGWDVRFFAIDEAHCISQWGHDFRPEYRQLDEVRQHFPGAAVHAFTATATPRVQRDIREQLNLRHPVILTGDYDRPNLYYRAEYRAGPSDGGLVGQVTEVIDRHLAKRPSPGEGAGIIYCIRRKDVDDLCDQLQGLGYSALPYHAGLEDAVRGRNQELFLAGHISLIVATVAFGMGIDRPDVRFVVHASMPKSLEHYQQEAGRAGRDSRPAECLLIWSKRDAFIWRSIFEKSMEGDALEAAMDQLSAIEEYARGSGCRHQRLTSYFGQRLKALRCGACDVCVPSGYLKAFGERLDEEIRPKANRSTTGTRPNGNPAGDDDEGESDRIIAQKILSCVVRVGPGFGARHICNVLRARLTPRVLTAFHDELTTFGLLRECARQQLGDWIAMLTNAGLLAIEAKGKEGKQSLEVTPEGWKILREEREFAFEAVSTR